MITIEVPGSGLVRDAVRQINKRMLNPVMLRLAGRRYWYAAALHHTGRRSGRTYVTPVVADEIDGGFLVPLPYGTRVDWLRNVLAAGEATLDVRGRTVHVNAARVLDAAEALPLLTPARARQSRLWRIGHFLRLDVPADLTREPVAKRSGGAAGAPAQATPDLRRGDARVHDLVAEIDEAIDAGDEAVVDELSARLRRLDPTAGAGSDT